MTYDAMTMRFNEFKLVKNPGCPLCGVLQNIDLQKLAVMCESKQGKNDISPSELFEEMKVNENIYLVDVREGGNGIYVNCRIPIKSR